jgi:hypothetical protein
MSETEPDQNSTSALDTSVLDTHDTDHTKGNLGDHNPGQDT